MKTLIWKVRHIHRRPIYVLRRGKTLHCGNCGATHNLNK